MHGGIYWDGRRGKMKGKMRRGDKVKDEGKRSIVKGIEKNE